MADELKAGDVVSLRSGGPKMTVTEVDQAMEGGALMAWCTWFDKNKEERGTFPVSALDKSGKCAR